MNEPLLTLIINAVLTPVMVLITLYVRASISNKDRMNMREDGYFSSMEKRILALEKEIREVRVELKNRDAEYIALYKEHTTLRAKYEVLLVDHEELKKNYEKTVAELSRLGNTCKEDHNIT